jgi:hypothetical protein
MPPYSHADERRLTFHSNSPTAMTGGRFPLPTVERVGNLVSYKSLSRSRIRSRITHPPHTSTAALTFKSGCVFNKRAAARRPSLPLDSPLRPRPSPLFPQTKIVKKVPPRPPSASRALRTPSRNNAPGGLSSGFSDQMLTVKHHFEHSGDFDTELETPDATRKIL